MRFILWTKMRKKYLLIWELFEVICIAFIPMLIVYQFLARPFIVQGASMEPNFHKSNYLVVDIISYKIGSPERGDVIVFRYPSNRSPNNNLAHHITRIISPYPEDRPVYHIKRIVGLPGERITFLDGEVFINGEVIQEDYIPPYVQTDPLNQPDFLLSESQYFVMGDNRAASFDSRSWGPLEKRDIVGAVRLRIQLPYIIGDTGLSMQSPVELFR